MEYFNQCKIELKFEMANNKFAMMCMSYAKPVFTCGCVSIFFCTYVSLKTVHVLTKYVEYIIRWQEVTNFMFEWQEQYLTRSLRSLLRYCSSHEYINSFRRANV